MLNGIQNYNFTEYLKTYVLFFGIYSVITIIGAVMSTEKVNFPPFFTHNRNNGGAASKQSIMGFVQVENIDCILMDCGRCGFSHTVQCGLTEAHTC